MSYNRIGYIPGRECVFVFFIFIGYCFRPGSFFNFFLFSSSIKSSTIKRPSSDFWKMLPTFCFWFDLAGSVETTCLESEDDFFDQPKKTEGTWVVEGKTDDEIIDFLESSASKHVVSTDPAKSNQKQNAGNIFQKSDDGRFIVEDLIEEENKKKVKKRTRSEAMPDKEDEDTFPSRNVPNTVVRPKVAKGLKNKTPNSVHSSIRYKSKKAGGDVLRKDVKFEPYAYVPLDPKQLNKRRRFHSHKQYESALTLTSKKGRAISKNRKTKK